MRRNNIENKFSNENLNLKLTVNINSKFTSQDFC